MGAFLWLVALGLLLSGLVLFITGLLILRAGRGTPADCPYIIVLGAQVDPDGPSVTLRERIQRAYEYLTAHPSAMAVASGGKGDDEHMAEGDCIFQELTAMGIDPERIWVEDKSTSTWGNLNYSLEIIEEKTGRYPTSVGVVSNEFHLFRAGLQGHDLGVTVLGIPARTGDFLRWLRYFIREIAGVWHFIILGGTFK